MDRLPSLLSPPLAFAAGGANPTEPDSSRAAFELAVRLGADGVEARVWSTRDGVAVLHPTGQLRVGRVRRRALSSLDRTDLPPDVACMSDLYGIAPDLQVSVWSADAATVDLVAAAATDWEDRHGVDAATRTWIRVPDVAAAADGKTRWPAMRWVHDDKKDRLEGGTERHAARLADYGIDAIRLPYPDVSGGLATLFHRFEVAVFGGEAVHDRMLDDLLRMGVDGVSTNHVDRMTDAFRRAGLRE